MLERVIKVVFAGLLWLFLIFGCIRTFISPMDLNYVENRYANKMPDFSFETYLDNSFQNEMEGALADQIYGAQYLKKWYNEATSSRILKIAEKEAEKHPNYFYCYRDVYLHDGRILWQPFDQDEFQITFDQTIKALNCSIDRNPTLPYYFYFVESDAVFDFKNNERIPVRENACAALHLAQERLSWFALDSYEEFVDQFYRTDHHWNYKGAYRGYRELHELLHINEACLTPQQEVTLSRRLTGSKATHAGFAGMWEYPTVYQFSYPELGIEYGHEAEILANPDTGSFSYDYFYGENEALVEFDTGRPERENILILGDSFDNAVLKLLASHFNKTYCVDMRFPDAQPFNIGSFAEEHDVDLVLIIASQVLFCGDFIVEG